MNFMNGRYGKFDLFDRFLVLVAALLCLFKYTRIISYVVVIYMLYRFFSSDIYKRQQEELKFQSYAQKIIYKISNKYGKNASGYKKPFNESVKEWINEKKNYKIFKCKSCGQKLRVPRGKGKIVITCKKCGQEFKAKS